MRTVAAAAGLLLVFSAAVSGSIYPWSSDMFTLAVLVLACFTVWEAGPSSLARVWPAWLMAAVVYASSAWSVNLSGTLSQAFRLTGYLLFAYVVSASASDPGRRDALLRTLFWSAVLVSMYGIYQYFIGFANTAEYLRGAEAARSISPGRHASAAATVRYGRVFSTMLSPNVLACYLAVAAPVGISLAAAAAGGARRLLYLSGLLLMLVAFVLTRSVGGVIALVSGMSVFLAVSYHRAGSRLPGRMAAAGGALAVLGLAVAFIRLQRSGPLGLGWSVEQRLHYWSGALDIWKASPLTGFGAGSFGIEYMRYMPAGAGETRYAHDLVLHLLAELGPPGVLAAAAVFGASFVWCIRRLRAPGHMHAAAVMAGVAAFLAHNLVDYTWYVPETAAAFWFLFGISASVGEVRPAGPSGRALGAAVTVLFLVFGVYQVRDYMAGQRASAALGVLAEDGITSQDAARTRPGPEEALELARSASALRPYDDSLHALLAGLYEGRAAVDGMKSVKSAEVGYNRAIELNPDYPFHYRDLGILYMRMRDRVRARVEFRKALERYPSSAPLKKYLEAAEKQGGGRR
ncbi:MAG: O-antigen ligase family protein [Nitrospirae bacterium]|nr:O-antigen ligase family protein [Nitrospirota bacterium]